MSLEFADLSDFYRDGEEAAHEHFEVFSAILECVARLYWRNPAPASNSLGITLDSDSLALVGAVESKDALRDRFNDVAGAASAESDSP